MTDINALTRTELAALVVTTLAAAGIDVVLVGGSCVCVYTSERFASFDLDFVDISYARRKAIAAELAKIGFIPRGTSRYFEREDCQWSIEFPSAPLAIGHEQISSKRVAELETAVGTVRLLSPTDCVKDRLLWWYLESDHLRRASAPMPPVSKFEFETTSIPTAFRFISGICGQTLSEITLDEIEQFPEMLLWIKRGHEFHQQNNLDNCLLCGNLFSTERRDSLTKSLDEKIDQFVDKLNRTAARLNALFESLANLSERVPQSDALSAVLAREYKEKRESVLGAVEHTRVHLEKLQTTLTEKMLKPASPTDLSRLPEIAAVEDSSQALATALIDLNGMIERHNKEVSEFKDRQEQAELGIRKHFLGECRDDFDQHLKEYDGAQMALMNLRIV